MRSCPIVLLVGVLLLGGRARAEGADEAYIEKGIALRKEHRDAEALTEFRRAEAIRPTAKIKVQIPNGVYGAYYCQAINATAPHPFAARLWQEFLYSDQGQLLWLKGFAHPALFQDLVKRKAIPAALLKALPNPAAYAQVKFAAVGQLNAARAKIASDWPTKVGA